MTKKTGNIEKRDLTRQLPCILTDEEKLNLGQEVGKESQELQEATDRKKEVTAQLTAEVESHRAAVQRLGSLLSNGFEYRPVKCEMRIDRKKDLVVTTRTDTGEVIERRPLRPSEMQNSLDLEGEAGNVV